MEIWVNTDNIADIFNLSGEFQTFDDNSVTEQRVEKAVKLFRWFLPGISSGKVSFQELLTLHNHLSFTAAAVEEDERV